MPKLYYEYTLSLLMKDESIDTIISDDITFRGTLSFNQTLKIKGQFKGTITSHGKLIIDETGDVEADVEVGSLVVLGNLKGNVDAKEKVELKKNGKVVGDIKTPGLEVEFGSKIIGNCIM
ncbi:polymer-forming cytoskeletal family protein [Leptospira ellinghausenii]|nr:polymer-forming cytoskeletal family protein [Leptospira ellinghausenii]